MSTGHNYIEDVQSGRIRFTRTGLNRFAGQLACCGISIGQIRTRAQFEAALDRMLEQDLDEVAALFEPEPSLESILADFAGEDADSSSRCGSETPGMAEEESSCC